MNSKDIEILLGSLFKVILEFIGNFFTGLKEIFKKRNRIITFIIMLVVCSVLYKFKLLINHRFIPQRYHTYTNHAEVLFAIPALYSIILGGMWKEHLKKFDIIFESVGLYSKRTITKIGMTGDEEKLRDYPKYVREQQDGKCTIFYFTSNGLSLDDWRSNLEKLESSIDRRIIKIEHAKTSKKVVKLYTVKTEDELKDYYRWKDEYIPEKDFEICLGEGLLEKITFNFQDVPHLLLAGETGAGKSVLQNAIAWQLVKKGGRCFFVDFKGGLELSHFQEFGPVLWEREKVIKILNVLLKENEMRLELFKEKGVAKLSEYNALVGDNEKLSRCFVVCDEAAEMLDKEGAEEEELKEINTIERILTQLARLARSQGIHLVLATQRPDAKVIKGQLRNNLPGRISGKMTDKEPSMMALGSTKAVDLPDIKGRFIYKCGVVMHDFQAYLFKKTDIKTGNYVKGKMLTDEESEAIARIDSTPIEDPDAITVEVKGKPKRQIKKKNANNITTENVSQESITEIVEKGEMPLDELISNNQLVVEPKSENEEPYMGNVVEDEY